MRAAGSGLWRTNGILALYFYGSGYHRVYWWPFSPGPFVKKWGRVPQIGGSPTPSRSLGTLVTGALSTYCSRIGGLGWVCYEFQLVCSLLFGVRSFGTYFFPAEYTATMLHWWEFWSSSWETQVQILGLPWITLCWPLSTWLTSQGCCGKDNMEEGRTLLTSHFGSPSGRKDSNSKAFFLESTVLWRL